MSEQKTNRETWYYDALKFLRPLFTERGYTMPPIRIGCGWTFGNHRTRLGECWSEKMSTDKTHEIFISPVCDDPKEILDTLVHEICHTIVGTDAKHRKPFIEVAKTIGLVGPWPSCQAGHDLSAFLEQVATKLGPYPHARLTLPDKKKGKVGSRLIKVQCPECDYIARVTRKHLTEKGAPICPIHKKSFKEAPPK